MDRLSTQGQAFQSMAAAMYDRRCTIKRRVSMKATDGGNIVSPDDPVASDIPCRLRPSSADERQVAGATQGGIAFTVRMPYWHNNIPLTVDSKCVLDIAAQDSGVEAMRLYVVAPLPYSGSTIDVVATKQS